MCAHYFAYTEGDLIEIQKIIEEWNRTIFKPVTLASGDVYPGGIAPVAVKEGLRPMKWGYPLAWGKGINRHARVETAPVKFRGDMLLRRCLLPASRFYEYSSEDAQISLPGTPKSKTARKVKYRFALPGNAPFHLAGLYRDHLIDGAVIPHFVVITARSAAPVSDVHDRMPVVLCGAGVSEWLEEGRLAQAPPLLEKQTA
jgi:putative SOS response-associated peptidase YedK